MRFFALPAHELDVTRLYCKLFFFCVEKIYFLLLCIFFFYRRNSKTLCLYFAYLLGSLLYTYKEVLHIHAFIHCAVALLCYRIAQI